jgi:hypothetical protein
MSINHILKSGGTTTIRDYRHAARIFTDNNFRLSPKHGFLFYVEFDFNPLITNISNISAQEMGMIVKTVSLPKYTIQVKEHNAYNRKNLVQNALKYDPVSITFHDDQADTIKNFWYDYYSYFYRDPDYADSTYSAPHKYQSRASFDWGYSPKAAVGYNNANGNQPYQYIQAIRIYSLYQKNFSEYELINPIITSFKHGEHTNNDTQTLLQHEMTVQFETVKYYSGYVTQNTVGGFVDLHYDNTPSPLTPAQGTNLIDNGNGGFTVASDRIVDLASINMSLRQMAPLIFNKTTLISASAVPGSIASGTAFSSTAGVNAGGFSIPSLGSLTQGMTSSGVLSQQLSASAATLAGTVTSQATNAVIGGLAKGLGPNGTAIVGLAAQAIANPKLLLNTVASAAINQATNWVVGKVTDYTGKLATEVGNKIAGFVDENITTPVSNAWSDLTAPSSQQFLSTGDINPGFIGPPLGLADAVSNVPSPSINLTDFPDGIP